MRKSFFPKSKTKKVEKIEKFSFKRLISKVGSRGKKKKEIFPSEPLSSPSSFSLSQEKEIVSQQKITATQEVLPQRFQYTLPVKYRDNRIVVLPRDPWWLHTYWDISESKIDEVMSLISDNERKNLKWILRVYDLTEVRSFEINKANSFFDLDINFDAGNWYINVNQPQRAWCLEIGLKSLEGKFFPVARSNITKTPYFGISSLVDEEWVLPEEEYFKVLGILDYGKSSLEGKRKFEELLKQQISSPLASWGISSLFSEKPLPPDKFFLEVATELILYGRTEPDAEVKVEGKKIDLRKDGTFSLRYALPLGDFKFEVVATSKNKKYKEKRTPAVKRYDK